MTPSTLSHLALAEKARREILHKSDLIPPLPDLVARLLGLLNQPTTEPVHLESLLQNDQVLVARMLATVNSPFYGLNRPIRTIKEAVMVLGFRGVRSLALATGTTKLLQRDLACYGHLPKGLWCHAVCVAAASRRIARAGRMSADDAELLFVAGLLHDVGKLLLVQYLVESGAPVPPPGSVSAFERQRVGMDHAEAGALVAAKWNLAPELQAAIRSHHVGEPAAVRAVAVVRLADAVAHELGVGYQAGCAPKEPVQVGDLAVLGLDECAWGNLRDELAAGMNDAVAALAALSS